MGCQCCDVRDIERLLFRYARCVDTADFDGLADLFRHAKVYIGPDESLTGDAVAKLWRRVNRVHPDGTLRTRHVVTNVEVDPTSDGDHANVAAYFLVVQATENLPLQPIVAGSYADTFNKVDGSWAFETMRIQLDLVGDVSEHLRIEL